MSSIQIIEAKWHPRAAYSLFLLVKLEHDYFFIEIDLISRKSQVKN